MWKMVDFHLFSQKLNPKNKNDLEWFEGTIVINYRFLCFYGLKHECSIGIEKCMGVEQMCRFIIR